MTRLSTVRATILRTGPQIRGPRASMRWRARPGPWPGPTPTTSCLWLGWCGWQRVNSMLLVSSFRAVKFGLKPLRGLVLTFPIFILFITVQYSIKFLSQLLTTYIWIKQWRKKKNLPTRAQTTCLMLFVPFSVVDTFHISPRHAFHRVQIYIY